MFRLSPAALLLPLIYLGFISLGLPDGAFGAAWPAMHRDLGLPVGMAGVIVVAVTLLSAFSGFMSGRVIGRLKTGPVVLLSCFMTGTALLVVARSQNLAWLLAAALPLGLGAGAVDAAINGYVAHHYSGRHMNWLHACWGLGATAGPLLIAHALATGGGWRAGYHWIATTQLSLAVLFLLTLRWWNAVPERPLGSGTHDENPRSPTTQADSVAGWLSVATFVLYNAAESMAGIWASSILVGARGVSPEVAGVCAAAFYGAIMAGRILVGFVVERLGNRRTIALGLSLAVAGAALFALARITPLAAVGLVALGLGLAPVYPCLMHEVPRRFAPEAVQTVIGRQSGAAGLGAALLPSSAGLLAQFSLEAIAWVIVGGVVAVILSVRRLNQLT